MGRHHMCIGHWKRAAHKDPTSPDLEVLLFHPAVELMANLKSISHSCDLFEVASAWELS